MKYTVINHENERKYGMDKATYMRLLLRPLILAVALTMWSCSDDDDIEDPVIDPVEQRITDQSGTVVEFTGDLVIGTDESDIVYTKNSDIMVSGVGHSTQKTLDCYGLAAIAVEEDGFTVDEDKSVENVTVINSGTITVHTKNFVDKYKDLIATPDDPNRPYYYIRVIGLYANKNCTVINKGTINVYFDHDPEITSTVYTIALTAHDNSTIINEGEIHFHGTGSPMTRFRGVATQGDDVTIINRGIITSDVEESDDQRGFTTGGYRNNLINDGEIRLKGQGEVIGISGGPVNYTNNNLIEITHVDDKYAQSADDQPVGVVGGILVKLEATDIVPSVINRGTIRMHAVTTGITPEDRDVHGIYVTVDDNTVNFVNLGTIETSSEGPTKIRMAEAMFKAGKCTQPVRINQWATTLRDFTASPLFMGTSAFDFTDSRLLLRKGDGYVDGTPYSVAPEVLNVEPGISITNYDKLSIEAADEGVLIDWDKEAMTVSLSQ